MSETQISERLAEIRKDAGLSQVAFAAKLGISQDHVSDLESGRRTPPEPLRIAICYKFAINPKWLEDGYGEKKAKLRVDSGSGNMGESKSSDSTSEGRVTEIKLPLEAYNQLLLEKAELEKRVKELEAERSKKSG